MSDPILTFFGKNRFLSNFYPAEVVWDNIVWPTSEHAYQAAKFDDREVRLTISRMKTPQEAKAVGKGKGDASWHLRSLDVMYEIVKAKFTQNPQLKDRLLATGDAHLEEGNTWHDTFWGVCPPGSNKGQNHLGKILMRVREELKQGDKQ